METETRIVLSILSFLYINFEDKATAQCKFSMKQVYLRTMHTKLHAKLKYISSSSNKDSFENHGNIERIF